MTENKKLYIEVSPTQDPTKKIKVFYTQELVQDLKAICGLDPDEELKRILQVEADKIYEEQYSK